MSGPQYDQSDDLVTQAVAATRQLPLPTGPSSAIVSQTLAALREAAEPTRRPPFCKGSVKCHGHQKQSPYWQRRPVCWSCTWVYRVSTARALAFADVVKVLNKVRSATWKITTEVKGLRNYETVRFWAAKWRNSKSG